MKRKMLLILVSVASLVILCDCDDILNVDEAGAKSSKEFCDCYKSNSLSYCEEKLNSDYSSYVNNDDFYTAFNKANKCGVTISKKQN